MSALPLTPQRAPPPHMNLTPSPAGPSSLPADDDENGEENIFRDMPFEEVLEDLNARFLVNLPEEETSLVRVYWQAEQAHWFYEDYLRPLNPLLPSLSQRQFTHLIIASSPLYGGLGEEIDYDAVWEEYCAYKKMVPCCGAIIISSSGDKVLMVRGWKSNAGWCFPRGKINSAESEVACAIREVEEETGFDLSGSISPNDFVKTQINAQEITMFLVKDIDESTVFETQTRKEIGAIEWVPFYELPTWSAKKGPKRTGGKGQKRFYNVTPFVGPLKKWLVKNGINPYPPRKQRAADREQREPPSIGRQLQPFTFDDTPTPAAAHGSLHANHPGHHHPTTTLDHLFAKFIQKDDNVVALESDTARTLDHMFGDLNVNGGSSTSAQQQESDNDALERLLGNIGTVPGTPPAPTRDPKQSKLLAVLNAPQTNAAPTSPPRSAHQTSLLSLLGGPSATASAHTPPPLQVPAGAEEQRLQRQQALLDSLFASEPTPPTPPAPTNRPQSAHSVTSSLMSPMPPLPPSQTQTWYGTPQRQLAPSPSPQAFAPRVGQAGQPPNTQSLGQPFAQSFNQPNLPVTPPRQAQPGQYANGPNVSNHQRALLGTLFGAKQPAHQSPPQVYGTPPGATQPSPAATAPPPPSVQPYGQQGPAPQAPPAGPYASQPAPGYGLNGQPGQWRPFGIPGQPGQPPMPGQYTAGPPVPAGHGAPPFGAQPGQPGAVRPYGQYPPWPSPNGLAGPGPNGIGANGPPANQPMSIPVPFQYQQPMFRPPGPPGYPYQPPQVPSAQLGAVSATLQPQVANQVTPSPSQPQHQVQQPASARPRHLSPQPPQPSQPDQHPPPNLATQQTSPSAVYQPVPRPPVGGGLLGLMGGAET